MKTISNVYQKLLDKEKIKNIIVLASKGKKKRKEVQKVLKNIDEYTDKIYDMLENKTYYMLPSHHKTIIENGKQRDLTISPFFPNRILDYIIVETTKPYIQKSMYEYCVGNVDKRGITFGKKAIRKKYNKYKYFLKLDIHHFYPSVSSDMLFNFLITKIRDKDFLALVKCVILATDDMPIGSYYSQWFSNWLLEELDHNIKEKCKIEFYIRYVDDMVLFSNNKRKLLRTMYFIENWLNNKNLKLKRCEQVKCDMPLDFLGFKFYKNKTYLRTKIFKKLNKRVRKIRKNNHISYKQASGLLSYIGWLKQTEFGYKYYENHIKDIVKIGTLKKIISNYATKNI